MHEKIDDDLRGVVQFHGHLCPGLALGYRVAKAALRELGTDRPQDEELVAVVENDSCAADAIQYVTGCTFGKGNFIFRDYGKHVYTVFSRARGKGVRISEDFRGFESDPRFSDIKKRQEAGEDVARERQAYMMEKAAAILKAEEKDLLAILPVISLPPAQAKISSSLRCAVCGEKFMESRGRVSKGRIVCIPCFERE